MAITNIIYPIKCNFELKSSLELNISTLLNDFDRACDLNLIQPTYISRFDIRDRYYDFLACYENDIIQGISFYKKMKFTSNESLSSDIGFIIESEKAAKEILEQYNSNLDLLYLAKIESFFPKKKGIGSTIINSLKENNDVGLIFLNSHPDAVEFYKFNNFNKTIIRKKNPVMYWIRDK